MTSVVIEIYLQTLHVWNEATRLRRFSIISRSLAWAKHYSDNAMLGAKSAPLPQLETLARDVPELGWACLNVDGAVSVPLNAGKIGGLIRSKDGDWVVGFVKAIGHSDVLQAELWALFEAGSSVLSLVRAIYRLRQENWATRVIWISRDDNRCDDALAKLANPSDFSLNVYTSPPLELDLLSCKDKSRV
ncbi:hypothetical protein V6N12_013330 [Hibiscus sabdariffa]|uniref:RNase H type-1 domain-containing protein n=1 Tax=Hibiscus sabdariffa TaxID=183260 RepID=A0ABR2D7W2_9ROSI